MALWLYEEGHQDRCDDSELARCVGHLESFLVRRFLCAMPPNNLNSMFGIMLSRLNRDSELAPDTGSVEDHLVTALMAGAKEWPDDETVRHGMLTHDFYNNGDTRQRIHVLRELDLTHGYDLRPSYQESDDSIEHILPQTKTQAGWMGV